MKIGRMEDVLLHFFDSCTRLNKLNDISSPLISKLVCSSSRIVLIRSHNGKTEFCLKYILLKVRDRLMYHNKMWLQ